MGRRLLAPIKRVSSSQLIVPLMALLVLVVFNLFRDIGFFSVEILTNNSGNKVLAGNLIAILNNGSELAVLAMGMTLVTASSKGQDISVGAAAAIAASVFISVLRSGTITPLVMVLAFFAACAVAVVFGAFNGTLVAVFNIQPMIATLILLTTGRSIAYWINGGGTPMVSDERLSYLGQFFPGVPIPSPVFSVILCGALFALVLKFTNIGLYAQAVGINEKSARLNGINTVWVKLLTYMILGVCAAFAGVVSVARTGLMSHEYLLLNVEMDAILAVAIGGNSLGGGKFSLAGSVLGAYIIQGLTTTLLAMKVASTDVTAYKAAVIIIIVAVGSPVVKRAAARLWARLFGAKKTPAAAEEV